jgi:sugar phosphate isomerase/epimerase
MLSISAFPKCWIKEISSGEMSLEHWIDVSVELEADGLEFYSKFLTSHDSTYLKEIRNRVEKSGRTIPMMCYSPDFTVEDIQERDLEISRQIDMIHATAELGGSFCRVLSGQNRADMSVETGIERVKYCIEACLPEAEKSGVKLVLENHYKDDFWKYREFAQKMDVFISLVDSIDSPWFGVQFDPSNSLVAGDDPIELMDYTLTRIETIHASDRFLKPGKDWASIVNDDGIIGYPEFLVHGVTGEGSINYHAIFERLEKINFSGWISIEDGVEGMDEMKRSINFLKEMRVKYNLL